MEQSATMSVQETSWVQTVDGTTDPAHVRVENLRKIFPSKTGDVTALDEIAFDIQKGEFVAIVGPSGCGKSTLLRLVAGLRSPTEGTIVINGREVKSPVPVGMVFQQPSLLPWRSALKNVLLSVELSGDSRRAYRARANELLELVGLGGFEHHSPSQLSGGMQQRVAICRALIHEPELLLMDEPFGALDALTRDEMAIELLRIREEAGSHKTVMFVTHSLSEAIFLADRIFVMSARPGRITAIQKNELPHPRTPEMRASAAFGEQLLALQRELVAATGEYMGGE